MATGSLWDATKTQRSPKGKSAVAGGTSSVASSCPCHRGRFCAATLDRLAPRGRSGRGGPALAIAGDWSSFASLSLTKKHGYERCDALVNLRAPTNSSNLSDPTQTLRS
jgi:hypothetical protein